MRYDFSLKWRGCWIEDGVITIIPLTIYRSFDVVRILDNNKIVFLVGDSSSGLVYERGFNKGALEAIQLVKTLNLCHELTNKYSSNYNSEYLLNSYVDNLVNYSQYCISLYEDEKNEIMKKHNKILLANKSIAVSGKMLTGGLISGIITLLFK